MSTILKAPISPYPLATKSQDVIPHDVTAPAGCYRVALNAGVSYILMNLPKTPIVAIACPASVLAVFTNETVAPTVVNGELIGGAMICPAGVTSIGRPATNNIILINESDEAIVVYVQLLHAWNILGTAEQTTRI